MKFSGSGRLSAWLKGHRFRVKSLRLRRRRAAFRPPAHHDLCSIMLVGSGVAEVSAIVSSETVAAVVAACEAVPSTSEPTGTA